MALDKLLQLIPGASVAAGDTISERTRKGIVEGVKLMYLADISTADGSQGGFVVTPGKLLIGELVYDFPGLTNGSTGLVASVAGGLSLSTVTGVQAVPDAVTGGAISTTAPVDVWAVTPAPMYKVDPFSVVQLTAAELPRLTNPLVVDIVVNPGHKVNKLRIEYVKHHATPANQVISVNGKSFSASANTVTAVDATLGLNLTIVLAAGRDATYEGDVTEAVVRDGVIHGLNASSPAGVSLSKKIAFGLSNTPRGDSFTTKGMVIAGQRVEFRDKSIYLGRITGSNTVDTSQAEVFQPYPR